MLPRSATNALVEAGIRQSAAEGAFGNKVIKYDHSVLGLVDVRIAYTPETATGPIIASLSPQGTVNTADVRLAAESSAAADCRFGRDDIGYAQMPYEMSEISDGVSARKFAGWKTEHTLSMFGAGRRPARRIIFPKRSSLTWRNK
jgi:hypothetical protein